MGSGSACMERTGTSRSCVRRPLIKRCSGVPAPGRLDGTAGAFLGVEGRLTAGAATGGRLAAAVEPEAEAGLGRPRGARRPGAAAPGAAADESAGDAGHVAALAPAAGPLAVDLSSQGRTPVH